MLGYWDEMTVTKMTWTAFHSRMVMGHLRYGYVAPSRPTVRLALQAFLSLLDIDYCAAFSCPCCPPDPKDWTIIICR